MSILGSVKSLARAVLAIEAAFGPPAAVAQRSAVGAPISFAEIGAAINAIKSLPVEKILGALADLSDIQNDALVAETILGVLNEAGVPYAGDASLVIRGLAWLLGNAPGASPSDQADYGSVSRHSAGR